MFRRILIVCGSLIYGAVFGEIFFRIYAPVPLMPRYVTAAHYGVRTNIPSANYWHWTPEAHVNMRINEGGMRSDNEFVYARDDDVCRIVVYGDSFFMGYEVAIENAVASLIEVYLEEAGVDCEVLNFSVSGFGTAEMLVALQNEGVRYNPDLVIFQWHRSDLNDNMRSGLFRLDGNELVRRKSSYLPAIKERDWLMQWGIYRWLIENSHLYSAVRTFAGRTIRDGLVNFRGLFRRWFRGGSKGSGTESSAVPGDVSVADTPKHRLNDALLREARAVAGTIDAQFLVATIPRRVSRTEFVEMFEEFGEELRRDIHWVSPIARLDHAAGSDVLLYYEKGGGHFSILGNEIAADAIVDYILLHSLVPKGEERMRAWKNIRSVEGLE